ncbi:DUF5665 domain-containing protein [Marinicrinis lubricantis]
MKQSPSRETESMPTTTTIHSLNAKLDQLALKLEAGEIAEYVRLASNPRRLLFRNLLAGIARGVGYAIGATVFLAILVYMLKMIGALNLPIIGDFIAEIVKIVQTQLQIDGYTGYQ